VFFSAGGATSKALAPKVVAAGAIVIDNSSAWRGDAQVPLVVAEVNWHALADIPKGIVANPNCTTMAAMPVLKPLHDAAGLKRLVTSTYQAVSGAGVEGIDILSRQLAAVGDRASVFARNGKPDFLPAPQKWAVPMAHNVVPLNYVLGEDDYTEEELKLRDETRKILEIPALPVSGTCVRVPVFTGHSLSINAEFERAISPSHSLALLRNAPASRSATCPIHWRRRVPIRFSSGVSAAIRQSSMGSRCSSWATICARERHSTPSRLPKSSPVARERRKGEAPACAFPISFT
jgi:aspartate-semialdehyde dehydrogenase